MNPREIHCRAIGTHLYNDTCLSFSSPRRERRLEVYIYIYVYINTRSVSSGREKRTRGGKGHRDVFIRAAQSNPASVTSANSPTRATVRVPTSALLSGVLFGTSCLYNSLLPSARPIFRTLIHRCSARFSFLSLSTHPRTFLSSSYVCGERGRAGEERGGFTSSGPFIRDRARY